MANKGNRAGEGPAKKKGGLLRRMGTLALVLCAVLAVVVLINPFGTRDEAEDPGVSNLPEWVTVDLLPENPYSRPGTLLERVNGVVMCAAMAALVFSTVRLKIKNS